MNKKYRIVTTEVGFRKIVQKSEIKNLKRGYFIDDEWRNGARQQVFLEDDLDFIKIEDQLLADSFRGGTSIYYCKEKDKYVVEHVSYTENVYSTCWYLNENCEERLDKDNSIAEKELAERLAEEGYIPL